ncbi:MAG: tetratricopeptide repeat protein [Desulfobacteraceae bacterium]|nr:MAG: tetratricopeptide repeat protein [Desulfobacteraceae bacterium]
MKKSSIVTCFLSLVAFGLIPLFSSCAFFGETGGSSYPVGQKDAAKFIGSIRPYHGDAESSYLFGCYLQERNKHNFAVEEFMRSVEIEPSAKAYNGMGVSYASLEQYAKAIEAYNAALMAEPKLDYVYNNLGYAHLFNGDPESAIKNFKLAIVLKRGKSLYHNNLGLAYAMSGKYNLALDEFREAVGEERAHASLAKIISRNDMHHKAAKYAAAPAITPPGGASRYGEAEKKQVDSAQGRISETTQPEATPFTEPLDEGAAQIAAASMIDPSEGAAVAGEAENVLDDIFSVRPSARDETMAVVGWQKESAVDIALGPAFDHSYRKDENVETSKILAEIFSVVSPATTRPGEKEVSEPREESSIPFAASLVIVPSDRSENQQPSSEVFRFASTRNRKSPVLEPGSAGIDPRPASDIKIEVSNGNGVNRMARAVGEYLKTKGFLPVRLTNAEDFKQLKTRIYYNSEYREEARRLAVHLPLGDGVEMVSYPLGRNAAVIRVVIGKDLVPYRASFQKR